MTEQDIRNLADKAGLLSDWIDATGQACRVSAENLTVILGALGYPCGSDAELAESSARLEGENDGLAPPLVTGMVGVPIVLPGAAHIQEAEIAFETGGEARLASHIVADGRIAIEPIQHAGYHRLRLGKQEITLAIAPPRCVTFHDVAPDKKMWGLTAQIYSLSREGDAGIGDTSALAEFAESAARAGADALAISPTHSLFAADPRCYAPYSPSSRLFLNPLLADPAMLFPPNRMSAEPGDVETSALIDWPGAGAAKYALLRRLHEDFAANDLKKSDPSPLARDFHAFVLEGGEYLRSHALFEALHRNWLNAKTPRWSWTDWPLEWRDPQSSTVKEFAAAQSGEVQFSLFLQWIADRSFGAVQRRARDAGMRIGIIADLAVGMDRGGSHAWSRQNDLLLGLNVGAPPDMINTKGQDWKLTGFSPQALVRCGFEPFIATLRAALRHAGGVRIDHAMGLMRLWLIPEDAPAGEGAYLRYPLDDLLNLLALESHRHNAIVIGEDLGTVPPEFRLRMQGRGLAGMDVLWFERSDDGAFRAPQEWRADSVGMTTTHDLPTVAGWWSGTDIGVRAECGFVSDVHAEESMRRRDRTELWRAFRRAKVTEAEEPSSERPQEAVDAAISFVASACSPLSLIPVEDVLGLVEQPNVPGTVEEHPNWRRRLDKPASQVIETPGAKRRLAGLRERRG